MVDVFISYARAEAVRAEEVRKALEALGLSVFYDVARLDAGDVWSDVIDRELKAAGVVVALWSPQALSRPWVKKECAVAQGRGVLVPALLEPVTDLDMPTQFSDLQRVDLTDWQGERDHAGWRKLVRALAKTLRRNDLLAAQIEALKEEKQTEKVKAELAAANEELAKLRKAKSIVKPEWIAGGVALAVILGVVGVMWGGGAMRASIVDPTVMKALSGAMPDDRKSGDANRILSQVFEKVSLNRLIEASTVDADAALVSGLAYSLGVGVPAANPEEAVRYVRRACDLKSMRACSSLGFMYENGSGVAKDEQQAAKLFAKSCDGGSLGGCSNLGRLYASGRGVAKDEARAVTLYTKACDGGHIGGCSALAFMYVSGFGVGEDDARAATLYDKACSGGYSEGCDGLGFAYSTGRGVAKDEARGVSLFSRACDAGVIGGCNHLGMMYGQGFGVAKDDVRAASLYAKACDADSAGGCNNLGLAYVNGAGVAKDEARGIALFAKACDGGEAAGCNNLGSRYALGVNVSKDAEKSRSYYVKACDLGDWTACRMARKAAEKPAQK